VHVIFVRPTTDSIDLVVTQTTHDGALMVLSRVVSPEISSGKFPEIYSYFSGNFRKIAGTILKGTFYHYKPSK